VGQYGLVTCDCVGIMVTTKKRQDFRIQLQKRARRRAEKKIEYLEDDKNWKDVSDSIHLCRTCRRNILDYF